MENAPLPTVGLSDKSYIWLAWVLLYWGIVDFLIYPYNQLKSVIMAQNSCKSQEPLIKPYKLSQGFQGNKIDLGVFQLSDLDHPSANLSIAYYNLRTEMTPEDFTIKCFLCSDTNWHFDYLEDHLLPVCGIISDELMHSLDMWNLDDEPCLLVVKNGNHRVHRRVF